MSKRLIFPQHHGDRKRPKLDITLSDHKFPLSQSASPIKDVNQDNWGDENDDEILLLASQACEEAYNDQTLNTLPDYSMCMQPVSTSTQVQPIPSTSKGFIFKKPSPTAPAFILKRNDKFERISSPLPGISSKIGNDDIHVSDDTMFNDKVCQGQDKDFIYRQLLQALEENAKLKSENCKLSEKCVTKEGEVSILRTQLKNCQVAVDNARMEKIRVQERSRLEWTDKLAECNNQMHDLRTQLDFKNLEVISIKEKCKLLESNKLKLTQVTLAGHETLTSQKHNNYNFHMPYEPLPKKVKTTSSAVQTKNTSNVLKLNTVERLEHSSLNKILHILMEPTLEQCSMLEYNDKLKKLDPLPSQCRIFSTFHRLPSTPNPSRQKSKRNLSCIYNDLTSIATNNTQMKNYLNIFSILKDVLIDIKCELEALSQRVTTAFRKEMDEKYIEATCNFLEVETLDLLGGRPLFQEEQAMLGRRFIAAIPYVIEESIKCSLFVGNKNDESLLLTQEVVDLLKDICSLLDETGCAILYSGLLLSITHLLKYTDFKSVTLIVRSIVLSRPLMVVSSQILQFLGVSLRKHQNIEDVYSVFCLRDKIGNLKLDYDQGVILYRKDSCLLQVLLKQIETALKCIQKQQVTEAAVDITRDLILLYSGLANPEETENNTCDCQAVLLQVMVYGLNICACLLEAISKKAEAESASRELGLWGVCRSALVLAGAVEGARAAGGLAQACRVLRPLEHHPIYSNMISEIISASQTSPEEAPTSFTKQAWIKSFQNFSITD